MWVLVAESGEQAGSCWGVEEGTLSIGRGAGCGIILQGGDVSPMHCVIRENNGFIEFEELEGANRTLLNGVPARMGQMRKGDKLTIGQTVFILANRQNTEPGKGKLVSFDSALHVLDLSAEKSGVPFQGNPQTVADLYWLFSSSRDLSMVRVRDKFLRKLCKIISERFKPDGILIHGLPYFQDNMDRMYKVGEVFTQNDMSPKEIIDKSGELTGGISYIDTSGEGKLCSLVSPITVGKERIGIVFIQRHIKDGAYCEQALEALVAFCKSVGPLYQSLSAVERNVTLPFISLADLERQHIMKLLKINDGNISATSKMLGISRTTLYHKLTEYGVRS